MHQGCAERHVVYGVRVQGNQTLVYFWDGTSKLTGDLKKSAKYYSYGDCIDPIWNGALWEETKKLKSLGFRKFGAIPLSKVDEHIDESIRANDFVEV